MKFVVRSLGQFLRRIVCLWLHVVVRVAALFENLAHFVAFVVKVGVVTTEASQYEKLREWNGIFNVLRMKGPMQEIVMSISSFVAHASR